jgi:hypothetical protein
MEQRIRRFVAVVPALALVTGLTVTAGAGARDRVTDICVIGGDIAACVPPKDEP